MEMEAIVKLLIFVLVLIIMVGIVVLFREKGFDVLNSIKDVLRFGR